MILGTLAVSARVGQCDRVTRVSLTMGGVGCQAGIVGCVVVTKLED